MQAFDHIDVATIEDAARAMKRYGNRAKLIAGGTDLLSILKDRILPGYPEKIINLKGIAGLGHISEDGSVLRIGPMAKLSRIAASPIVREKYGVLARAAESVATPEIRNVATIGGNLCQDVRCWYYRYPKQIGGPVICRRKDNKSLCPAIAGDNRYHAIIGSGQCVAVCSSDMAVALAALNSVIQVTGPLGSRLIPVNEFYKPMGNSLKTGEIISEIQVLSYSDSCRQAFIKYTLRKPVDFAVVSVASVMKTVNGVIQGASIYLGAVAAYPVRAKVAEDMIKGRRIDEVLARQAADAQVTEMKPLSKNGYKVEIARSLIKQAILI